MTAGGMAAVQAFTPNCRACGHKVSLHQTANDAKGNSYAAPFAARQPQPQAPQPQAPPAGWYPDPGGQPSQLWWDGQRWSEHTAPAVNG